MREIKKQTKNLDFTIISPYFYLNNLHWTNLQMDNTNTVSGTQIWIHSQGSNFFKTDIFCIVL